MTLTQFVQSVKMMRDAQIKYKESQSISRLTQVLRMERLVDTIIEEFFKEQVKNMPTQTELFPPN